MDKYPPLKEGLQQAAVVNGLAKNEVGAVIQSGLQKKLRPNSILFHQGDPAKHCYLVNRGRLKLTKLNEQGKEVIIGYIGAGELTAAVALFKNRTYPVTAESTEDTDVIGWDKPKLIQLMHRYPDIAINLLGVVLERIDQGTLRSLPEAP